MPKTIDQLTEDSAPNRQDTVPIWSELNSSTNKTTLETLLAYALPPGQIVAYAGTTAPLGWLICDGSAVSRNDYSDLFSVTSTLYGAGNGTTTFNLPDLRGKIPVGKNSGTFSTLGATGGEETHQLTTTEMPSHSHTWTGTNQFIQNVGSGGAVTNTAAGSTWQSRTPTGTNSNSGSDGAHNNLQPYQVINYLIKT